MFKGKISKNTKKTIEINSFQINKQKKVFNLFK